MSELSLISVSVFLPSIVAALTTVLAATFSSRGLRSLVKPMGLLASIVSSCFIVWLFLLKSSGGVSDLGGAVPWLPFFSVNYDLSFNGLNASLVALLALVFPLVHILDLYREDYLGRSVIYLLLQTGLLGAAFSQDLFLIFLFWSFCILPAYYLISVYSKENGPENGFSYLINGLVGNSLVFMSIILTRFLSETPSFSVQVLFESEKISRALSLGGLSFSLVSAAFIFLIVGIFIRISVFPFHSGISRSVRSYPSVFIVLHYGAFLPVGFYIFTKLVLSIFGNQFAYYSRPLLAIGVVGFVYGAFRSSVEKDLRSIGHYLFVSFSGLLLSGLACLNEQGVLGAMIGITSIGLTGALFGIVNSALADRGVFEVKSAKEKENATVISTSIVLTAGVVVLFCAVLGAPGTINFVSTSLIAFGVFEISPWYVLAVLFSFLLLATSGFRIVKFLLFYGVDSEEPIFLKANERLVFVPVISCIVFLGVSPNWIVTVARPVLMTLVSALK